MFLITHPMEMGVCDVPKTFCSWKLHVISSSANKKSCVEPQSLGVDVGVYFQKKYFLCRLDISCDSYKIVLYLTPNSPTPSHEVAV